MVTKTVERVSITELLLAVSWRPFASYQLQMDSVVCVGALVGVLALFFIKHKIETHTDATPRGESLCKAVSVAVISASENASETPMADTINPGTRLIEEVALFPESVRFESEPWTSFYTAGEIIRELRKAHENKQVIVPATKDDMRKAA